MPKFLMLLLVTLSFTASGFAAEKSRTQGLATWGAYLVLGLNYKDAPKLTDLSNDVALPAFFQDVIGVDEKHEMAFVEVSEEKAKTLKLTAKEIEGYNGEIGKLNSMLSETLQDLTEMSSSDLHESAMKWREHKLHLSQETLSVLTKVGSKR